MSEQTNVVLKLAASAVKSVWKHSQVWLTIQSGLSLKRPKIFSKVWHMGESPEKCDYIHWPLKFTVQHPWQRREILKNLTRTLLLESALSETKDLQELRFPSVPHAGKEGMNPWCQPEKGLASEEETPHSSTFTCLSCISSLL